MLRTTCCSSIFIKFCHSRCNFLLLKPMKRYEIMPQLWKIMGNYYCLWNHSGVTQELESSPRARDIAATPAPTPAGVVVGVEWSLYPGVGADWMTLVWSGRPAESCFWSRVPEGINKKARVGRTVLLSHALLSLVQYSLSRTPRMLRFNHDESK